MKWFFQYLQVKEACFILYFFKKKDLKTVVGVHSIPLAIHLNLLDTSIFYSVFSKIFSKKKEVKVYNPDNLKGGIHIGYCMVHKTLILFLNFEGYQERHKRLLPLKFGF